MKGLLIKDLLGLKGFGRISILLIAAYGVIAFATGNVGMLSSILLVFCAMLPMTATALDEQSKWNAYAQCMPVDRRQIVLSKYILAVIVAIGALVLSLLITLLTTLRAPVDWPSTLLTNGAILCMLMIMNAVIQPAIYKFGVEKARLLIILVFAITVMPLIYFMGDMTRLESILQIVIYALPVLAIALFIGSYFLSAKIYLQKEF